ncbi:MAG: ferredoxin [Candidatus Aenigmarchaeota archaeon]|nr:ferredoxin [Candidatus Aenigmarchaeota archaeon]
MVKFKVTVNKDSCISCMACASICGDVFEIGEDGKSQIVEKFRTNGLTEGIIGEDLENCVNDAINVCPSQSIKIEKIED